MFTNNKISKIAAAVALSVGLSTAAMAQETSSAMEGRVIGPGGQSAAGTLVTVVHVPSGTSRQVTVSENGTFTMRGLRVGGPYQIIADSNVFQDTTVDGVFLNLGEAFDVSLQLEDASDVEVISVNASSVSTSAFGSTGPQSIFSLEDLQNAPAINRDINDIIRADPRIFVDESFNDAVRCGGASPRFNSLTLDGVRMNDSFGLNSNGYPTERMPFSFDAIQEVAVELAPFDVQYGGFTACNINAVTKSGTNKISGGVFYDYTSDSFRGDTADGVEQDNGNYTEKRYGVHIGAPIIKDKLFIFAAYEKLEGAQLFDYNFGDRVTSDDISRITEIAQRVYNYDVGGTPGSAPVEDEKILVKLDWNINDDHRATLTYNYNDGFSLSQSDGGFGRVSLSNHFYERGAELDATILSVYSNWTDNFSTELRIGSTNLDNRQTSLDAASGFGEAQIRTADGGTVFIGPDDSRQSNDLNWEMLNFKLAGTYYMDNHTITAGVEVEELDVFNLFMQHTIGEYRFGSIEEFESGLVDRIYYNNSAGTNNPADAGASFTQKLTTFYIQDEFYLTDDLQVMLGLRYDAWSTDDEPRLNQNFAARYGFFNTNNVDGIDLLQPRAGFNWAISDDFELRGGLGLYSGGNPNVWISNAYSNDGVTNISTREFDLTGYAGGTTDLFGITISGDGSPIYNPPQDLVDVVAGTSLASGDGNTVATDPDFTIPSEWKYSLGFTYLTESDYVITGDYIFTNKEDSALYRDANLTYVGSTTSIGGRPAYGLVDSGRRVGSDYILSNASGDGKSTVISIGISKDWDNGFDATFGYAYVEAEDANPMTSAVAFSNYVNFATTDPNNPVVATSDYETPHRVTLSLSYAQEFIDGYETRFTMFGQASDGEPISYTMDQGNARDGFEDAFPWDTVDRRQLLYVPVGDGSDGVTFTDAADEAAFFAWADAQGFERGENTSRNSRNADWWIKTDVRISQELPGFMEGHRASAFLVIENFTNLLNDEWGDYRQGSFVGDTVIDVDTDGAGNFFYSDFSEPGQSISRAPSLWEIRVGVNYKF
ncbi:TonB-dependent receptor [Glaciecola petra]|uniref:TonB-dependent receptor n=1 Tax=Glaciecola petra TaxID=3075602 RepID=A0ABU2ZPB6_9ALTE|nr:TonB-dependent receptor [Aestuariibacter sp. P117]MDT0593434.1 TonB-dependent receptor [Aestuariibacter sp. P117]